MFKFYDIDTNYIKFLKQIDKQVPDIKYTTTNKFVCGVVLNIDGIQYYAPISHKIEKQQTSLQIFDNDRVISTIRFSFMIPAFAEVLTVKDFKTTAMQDSRYADLLYTEYTHCRTHLNDIQRKALSVYRIGCNKQHRLNYTCCNFKKLEQYYLDYKIQL